MNVNYLRLVCMTLNRADEFAGDLAQLPRQVNGLPISDCNFEDHLAFGVTLLDMLARP